MTETAGATDGATWDPAVSRLLTFLIADMRGYTRFSMERGDRAAAHLSERFLALSQEIVAAHGGEVFGSAGDRALAAFPSAHAALRAALGIQGRLARELEQDPGCPWRAGIGLDIGEGILLGNDYRGNAINLAARLCSIAGAGEIFASEAVMAVARLVDGVVAVDRGEIMLKGFAHPVRVVQIAAEGEIPAEVPPLQPILVTHPNNLPDDPSPFVGREREIAAIAALLHDPHIRLVTLTGPGGTGKTRLALQVSNTVLYDFPDGVYFCDLSSLTDPALVPSALVQVLGVSETHGRDLTDIVIDRLREQRILLVLDNFEHVLDACRVVSDVLRRCRRLHILVTSRTPLHITGEYEHAVPPLSVPDPGKVGDAAGLSQYESVTLFLQRAKAAKDTFTVTDENAAAVAEICSRLDGLPLAIELAAARIKLFPPQALLQRLSPRLTLLTGGARDRPSRHQTLRAAIDWSYSLLTQEEQVLFASLSVFAGGSTFEAAEAVCNRDGELDLLEGMTSLVDKSLVRQVGDDEPRFSMLETIREYAQEKLLVSGQATARHAAHGQYFLELARRAEPELVGSDQGRWFGRLATEHENLRAALAWSLSNAGDPTLGLGLAASVWLYWYVHGHLHEGYRWLSAVLDASQESSTVVRATALRGAGAMLYGQRLYKDAAQRLEEALALYRDLGDRQGEAAILNHLAVLGEEQEDFQTGRRLYEESLALQREFGDRAGIALVVSNLGALAHAQGDYHRARALYEEALVLVRELGHVDSVAISLANLGELSLDQHDPFAAAPVLTEALQLAVSVGDREVLASCLDGFGRTEFLRGDPLRAAMLHSAASAVRETIHAPMRPQKVDEYRDHLEAVRGALGDEGFQSAWSEGQGMSPDDAVAYAVSDVKRA